MGTLTLVKHNESKNKFTLNNLFEYLKSDQSKRNEAERFHLLKCTPKFNSNDYLPQKQKLF